MQKIRTISRLCGSSRVGWTVVELLIVVAIIGILLGLLLPAVQQARSSARRIDCMNRLRQLGVAIHGYEEMHSHLPPSRLRTRSWLVYMLPWVEQHSVFNQIDTDSTFMSKEDFNLLARTVVPAYRCPSDSSAAETNYFANVGLSHLVRQAAEPARTRTEDGFFAWGFGDPIDARDRRYLRSADVTDGLSNTAAVSEAYSPELKLNSVVVPRSSSARGAVLSVPGDISVGGDFVDFARRCESLTSGARVRGSMGKRWSDGENLRSLYHHILVPNSNSCMPVRSDGGGSTTQGVATANSIHAQGVNVLLGDGSGKFWSDSVDVTVWRALGTRSGGDVVGF